MLTLTGCAVRHARRAVVGGGGRVRTCRAVHTEALVVPPYPPPAADRIPFMTGQQRVRYGEIQCRDAEEAFQRFVTRWSWMFGAGHLRHAWRQQLWVYRDPHRQDDKITSSRFKGQDFKKQYMERLDPRKTAINDHLSTIGRLTRVLQHMDGVSAHYLYNFFGMVREDLALYNSTAVSLMCLLAARTAVATEFAGRVSLRTEQKVAVQAQARAFVAEVTERIASERDFTSYLNIQGCAHILIAMSVLQMSNEVSRRRLVDRMTHGECFDSCDVDSLLLALYVRSTTDTIPTSVITKLLQTHPRWSLQETVDSVVNMLWLCASQRIPLPDAALAKCFRGLKASLDIIEREETVRISLVKQFSGQIVQIAGIIYHYNFRDEELLANFVSVCLAVKARKRAAHDAIATVYTLLARLDAELILTALIEHFDFSKMKSEVVVHVLVAFTKEEDLPEGHLVAAVETLMERAHDIATPLLVRVLVALGRLGGRAGYADEIDLLESIITQKVHELNGHALNDFAAAFRTYTPGDELRAALLKVCCEAAPRRKEIAIPALSLLSMMNAPLDDHLELFDVVLDGLDTVSVGQLLASWQALRTAKIALPSAATEKIAKHLRPAASGLSIDDAIATVQLLASAEQPLSRSAGGLARTLAARVDRHPKGKLTIYQKSGLSWAYQVLGLAADGDDA